MVLMDKKPSILREVLFRLAQFLLESLITKAHFGYSVLNSCLAFQSSAMSLSGDGYIGKRAVYT
jgi:hypothetical protein